MFVLLLLFIIPNIVCQREYQTIPLRYNAVTKHLIQSQYDSFLDLLDDLSTYNITSETISTYISLLSSNRTSQCDQDLEKLRQGISKRDIWALKILDAWGKPLPSGVLKGNLYVIGSYDECIQPMYIPTNKTFVSQPFDAQHCTLYPGAATSEQMAGANGFVFGLCIPSSCDRESVISLIHTLFNKSNLTENDLVCSNDPPNGQKGLTAGAIAVIVILALLGLLVFLGTILDLILISKRHSTDDMTTNINGHNDSSTIPSESIRLSQYSTVAPLDVVHRLAFLAEFSALRTLRRIFTMKQKKDNDSYPFINGIRVLSLCWVIIGHSFLFGITFTSNILDVITWTRNISLQLILNATFSVDTFFVLSGFLTTMIFVRQVEKEKKLSFRLMVLYYVHRYIRLTPTFLLVVFISIHLTPYFGDGPVYPTQQGFEVSQCRTQYWWTSVLYVGNIVKPDYMCLPIAWYLHNDMQFHWIAPLSLIPFVIGRKPLAFIISILFTLIGIGSIAGLLIYYPNFQSSGNLLAPPQTGPTFSNTIYIAPWCRISAYFIGVLTGFLVINTGRSYRIKRSILLTCSIIAIVFGLIYLFAIYPDYILVPGIDRISFIIYQSLSRTLWSITIGWLFFLCMTNRGGIINRILSWPIWIPLARLNYSTYLIHLTVIFIMITNQRIPFYYQPHSVINNFITHIVFSYLTAIFVVIFIENPFFIIEKILFKR